MSGGDDVEVPGSYHVEVRGSVGGNLVVGDHNLIVNAATGSAVTVLQEADRPKPVRRSSIRLLPRRPGEFVGRAAELGAIAAAVVAQSAIQVYGPRGIGKSTLLRQSAHAVADSVSGVAFLTVAGLDRGDVLQEIFEACYETSGYRPGSADLRQYLSGVRAALFVDDLVADDDALATILDTVPDAAFVFASLARELWGQGQVLELAGLPEDQAMRLFRQEFGRDLTAAEQAAAARSWRESGGVPIVLLRAAAVLAAAPAHLPDVPAQRDADDPERTVAYSVALTATERDVFDLLLAVPGPISLEVMTRLVGAPEQGRVRAAADRLVQVGLADMVEDMYRPAADLAADPGSPDRVHRYRRPAAALAGAMLDWLGSGGADPGRAARHSATIVALIDAAVADGGAVAACRLARAASAPMALSLRWGAWRDVLISGQAAATACNDREAIAYFTHERGIRMLCLGEAAAAAAVLASAAGMWHALGSAQSAMIASNAQAIAAAAGGVPAVPAPGSPPSGPPDPPGGSNAPGSPNPAGGPSPAGGPNVPGPPADAGPGLPVPRPPRPPRRFIGRAVARRPRSRFPVLTTVAAGVAVLALIAAGVVIAVRYRHHPAPKVAIASPSPSTSPIGPPVAFSLFSQPGSDPAWVLDNDPGTVWSSTPTQVPQAALWIAIDMQTVGTWTGVTVTPRARGLGFPSSFRIESSVDGVDWLTVAGQDYNADNPLPGDPVAHVLTFGTPVTARYIRLFAYTLTPVNGPARTSVNAPVYALQIAEMHVLS